MKKISIIIPVFNVENYLDRCLSSVESQNYKNLEVIIVCDKSDDNSEKIVNKFINKNSIFKKIYKENTGLSEARNIGIKNSNGEYFILLDGDDFLEEDFITTIAKNLKDNPELLRFQAREVYKDKIINYEEVPFNNTNSKKAFEKISKYHFVENAWLYCYNRKFYIKNKFRFMKNCVAEDYGLIPFVISKAESIKSISYVGYNYVQRDNSLMHSKSYYKKLKKMEDMISQALFLEKRLEKDTEFIRYIFNSLYYYATKLKYIDYIKYTKKFNDSGYLKYIFFPGKKYIIKNILIKTYSYYFYCNLRR